MQLLNIFANNILPILLISGGAFALGKVFKLDPRPLGKIIFYIFSPLLVFNLITTTKLPLDRMAVMMGFAILSSLILAGIGWLLGSLFHLDRSALIVVILTSLCMNAGNFGLPLVSFAFGQEALAYAGIYFVASMVVFYSVGVIIASLGNLDFKHALLGIVKVPAIYAIVLALVCIETGLVLPEWMQRTIKLAGDGAIPGMLVLLGLELTSVQWTRNMGVLAIPVFIRLVIGPLVGLPLASLFGLHGPAYQAGISENGTPTAVMTTILASEYKLDASLVTAIIFAGTILSPLTLTPVLYFLGK
jgi:malate permease and related proteins